MTEKSDRTGNDEALGGTKRRPHGAPEIDGHNAERKARRCKTGGQSKPQDAEL